MPSPASIRTVNANDISGTGESVSWLFTRGSLIEYPAIRFVNDTDVDIDIKYEVTDSLDGDWSRAELLTFYGDNFIGESLQRDQDTVPPAGEVLTVPSGGLESRVAMQLWNKVRVTLIPVAEPTSGTFKVIFVN